MSNNFSFEPVTRKGGTVVTQEELESALGKPVPVRFDYGDFEGLTVLFDRSKIPAQAILGYQRAEASAVHRSAGSAELVAEAQDLAPQMAIVRELGSDADEVQVDAAIGIETRKRIGELNRRLVLVGIESEPELFSLRIALLTPAIVGWNVPKAEPTIETLERNGELAEAVIGALWEAYRPTSRDSAAASATTPNPSETASATSSRSTKANSRSGASPTS